MQEILKFFNIFSFLLLIMSFFLLNFVVLKNLSLKVGQDGQRLSIYNHLIISNFANHNLI